MAIKFKQLERIANTYTERGYVYKDLFLDITQTKQLTPGFNEPVPGADIKADFDIGAIVNSLTNLFNTLPGQRFLFPEYGLDLYQYLFEPLTQINGESLGRKIYDSIKLYEPRVIPRKVNVLINPDLSQYTVSIIIEIPILNLISTTDFLFDVKKQSFIYLPTSRNK
jgi:phage baseplate assembly protein W